MRLETVRLEQRRCTACTTMAWEAPLITGTQRATRSLFRCEPRAGSRRGTDPRSSSPACRNLRWLTLGESHAMRNARKILSAIAMAVVTLGAAAPGFTQSLLASYPTLTTDAALRAAQAALARCQKQ